MQAQAALCFGAGDEGIGPQPLHGLPHVAELQLLLQRIGVGSGVIGQYLTAIVGHLPDPAVDEVTPAAFVLGNFRVLALVQRCRDPAAAGVAHDQNTAHLKVSDGKLEPGGGRGQRPLPPGLAVGIVVVIIAVEGRDEVGDVAGRTIARRRTENRRRVDATIKQDSTSVKTGSTELLIQRLFGGCPLVDETAIAFG